MTINSNPGCTPGVQLSSLSRRHFSRSLSFAVAAFATPGLFAEELAKTPGLGEGPFYPDQLPLDTDNDLLLINDAITPGLGDITHLSGQVLSTAGEPIRNAFVEIWQCDNNGAYIHSGTSNKSKQDSNFQGYGRFLTDSKGRYYFRTIKPVAYPGRTPHIHFAISQNGKRVLTTQMLIEGNPQNQKDGIFRTLKKAEERKLVTAKFAPLPESKMGELTASFDLVIGKTPNEDEIDLLRGVSPSDRSRRG